MNKVDLKNLLRLRDLDVQLMELEREISQLPHEYALEEEAARRADQTITEAEAVLQKAKLDSQHAESDVSGQDAKIKKHSEQLSTAKTNKEYQLILGQINGAKMELAKVEEAGLVAMEKVEEVNASLLRTRAEAAEALKTLEAAKVRIGAREKELQAEATQLREQREAIASGFDEAVMTTYEQIRERREGVAVVEVIEGTCHGCYVKVTAQEGFLLAQRDVLVRCRTCARILVLPD